MQYKANHMTISKWAEEDRPREKLQLLGKQNLTDSEILAILLGSGTKDMNVINLAQSILSSIDHNLSRFKTIKRKDLLKFKGVGPAKAAYIFAAIEFGNRIHHAEKPAVRKISTSADAYHCLKSSLTGLDKEEFWVLLLNKANLVIAKKRISIGGISATIVDSRIVFSCAIESLASSIILAHNHPSGNLKPSKADLDITQKIKEGAVYFDITVLDHLIIAGNDFFSFADEGMMR